MKIKSLSSELFEQIRPWYGQDFNWDVFTGSALGFVAMDGRLPIAAGFLISTNAGFCLMEHLQVNPKVNKIRQGRAIMAVATHIVDMAKSIGYKAVLGFTEEKNTSIRGMHKRLFEAKESNEPLRMVYKIF